MSTVSVIVPDSSAHDILRESWRQVMSMRRSTQQFRARLERGLSAVESENAIDPQFGEVAATMTVMVRILDWAMLDLGRLKLPEELFEVVPPDPVMPGIGTRASGSPNR